jgi:hypothetical protein
MDRDRRVCPRFAGWLQQDRHSMYGDTSQHKLSNCCADPHEVKNVDLIAEYGYIVDWPAEKKPMFYVFNKPSGTRIRTSNWDTFIAELRKVPDRSEVDSAGKCSVPFSWGMPEEKQKELDCVLAAKSLKPIGFADGGRHVEFCYCETKAVVVLSDEAR